MKRVLLALGLLSLLSCAKPLVWADPEEPENSADMVTVLFSAAGSPSKATGITDASERVIGRWAVFAFDDSSNWYRYATSDSGEDIPMNLRAGRQYTCYAVVNYSTTGTGAFIPSQISSREGLTGKTAYLGDNAPGRLLMFGSQVITPVAGSQDCSISVKRIVSRINVEGIAIDFSAKPHLAQKTFTLRHVYITNAYRTTPYGNDYRAAQLSTNRKAWYNSGGWHRGENAEDAMDDLLGERNINAVLTKDSPYTRLLSFYAFPNPVREDPQDRSLDPWSARCTRIVLEATLGDDTVYYQVDVPAMERNHVYCASNLVIRGRGSSDPEIKASDALDVSFDMNDGWDGNGQELNL